MKIKFDIDVDTSIQGIEIEAESEEAAKEKLLGMTFSELVEEGYVDNYSVDEVTATVLSAEYSVKVTNVSYKITKDDLEDIGYDSVAEAEKAIPASFTFEGIDAKDEDDLRDNIDDLLFDEAVSIFGTNLFVKDFDYKITEVK